jgi:methylase of polypeptide subunit release factors
MGQWKHIRRNAESRWIGLKLPSIFASDQTEAAVNSLKENLHRLGFGSTVSISVRNFFDISPGR